MYVYFVYIDGIDEKTFWDSDISFLDNIHQDIVAYENYIHNPKEG